MAAWYEVLISSSFTALCWIFFRIGELQSGEAKVFAMLGVAVIPTIYFQVKNTTFPLKKKGFFDGDTESSGFWVFALILNTLLTSAIAIFVYAIFWVIFDSIGFHPARLW